MILHYDESFTFISNNIITNKNIFFQTWMPWVGIFIELDFFKNKNVHD